MQLKSASFLRSQESVWSSHTEYIYYRIVIYEGYLRSHDLSKSSVLSSRIGVWALSVWLFDQQLWDSSCESAISKIIYTRLLVRSYAEISVCTKSYSIDLVVGGWGSLCFYKSINYGACELWLNEMAIWVWHESWKMRIQPNNVRLTC